MYLLPEYNNRLLSASDAFGAFLFDGGSVVNVDLAGIYAPVGPQDFALVQSAVGTVFQGSTGGMSLSTLASGGPRPFGLTIDNANFNDIWTYGFLGAHVQGEVFRDSNDDVRFSGELFLSDVAPFDGRNDTWDANISSNGDNRPLDAELFTWLAKYLEAKHGADPFAINVNGSLRWVDLQSCP